MKKQISLVLAMISLWSVHVQVMVAPPSFSEPINQNNVNREVLQNKAEKEPFHQNEHENKSYESENSKIEKFKDQREQPEKEALNEINKEASSQVIPVDDVPHYSVTSGIDFDDKEDTQDLGLIDTSDSTSGGNWLLKRVWGEKTEDIFGQIKNVIRKIMEMRIDFFNQRNDIDKKFDQFYQQLGFKQGPFEDILNFALEIYDKVKKDGLSLKEKDFYQVIQEKQAKIEQLKKDVEAIIILDGKINEALDVVLQQIDLCNKYEDQAWENFRDILRELNDKEARIEYYETKGILDDVNKIAAYLAGPFKQYFSQSTQSAQDHMRNILSQIDQLKKDGVDLKREADLLEKEDEEIALKNAQEKQEKIDENKEKMLNAKIKPVALRKASWWSVTAEFFLMIYQKSIDVLMSFVGGSKKVGQGKDSIKKESVNEQRIKKNNEQFKGNKLVEKDQELLKSKNQNEKVKISKWMSIKETVSIWFNKGIEFFTLVYRGIIDKLMNFFGGNKKFVAMQTTTPQKLIAKDSLPLVEEKYEQSHSLELQHEQNPEHINQLYERHEQLPEQGNKEDNVIQFVQEEPQINQQLNQVHNRFEQNIVHQNRP